MLLGVLVEAVKAVSTIEREQLDADFARKASRKNLAFARLAFVAHSLFGCIAEALPVRFFQRV